MRPSARQRGFTLVELMLVVMLVGVLAALAIYGVRKYVIHSKTTEARNSIGQMAKDALTAYVRGTMDHQVLQLGTSAVDIHLFCLQADQPVPDDPAKISGRKYQSTPSEWSQGSPILGWQCLKFSMEQPQYYQYYYVNWGSPEAFGAVARGDIDGDGNLSAFSIYGIVQYDTDGSAIPTVYPVIDEDQADE